MVTLIVATTTDPASFGPANALLAMPGWQPGPTFQGVSSFVNGEARVLKHDKGIVEEDDLDRRWEEETLVKWWMKSSSSASTLMSLIN